MIPRQEVDLYRADRTTPTASGPHGRWWAADLDHARYYTATPGFGGSRLYRTVAVVEAGTLLDLRPGFWRGVSEALGFERGDYPDAESDHDRLWGWWQILAARGYTWVVLRVLHPTGMHDEWMYTGDAPLQTDEITS